jgi:hypothetical protein
VELVEKNKGESKEGKKGKNNNEIYHTCVGTMKHNENLHRTGR